MELENKMRRQDEEYTKNAISKYLGKTLSQKFTITEGENPPDYYVDIGSKKIALEITRAELDRKTVDVSLSNLCNQINDHFESKISAGTSIMLFMKGPIPKTNFQHFKKLLKQCVEQIIEEEIVNDWKSFDVSEEIVRIKKIIHGRE